jgi:hypothetical protein
LSGEAIGRQYPSEDSSRRADHLGGAGTSRYAIIRSSQLPASDGTLFSGVRHRDISTGNIVQVGERYMLIDYALASSGPCDELDFWGTVPYMCLRCVFATMSVAFGSFAKGSQDSQAPCRTVCSQLVPVGRSGVAAVCAVAPAPWQAAMARRLPQASQATLS